MFNLKRELKQLDDFKAIARTIDGMSDSDLVYMINSSIERLKHFPDKKVFADKLRAIMSEYKNSLR